MRCTKWSVRVVGCVCIARAQTARPRSRATRGSTALSTGNTLSCLSTVFCSSVLEIQAPTYLPTGRLRTTRRERARPLVAFCLECEPCLFILYEVAGVYNATIVNSIHGKLDGRVPRVNASLFLTALSHSHPKAEHFSSRHDTMSDLLYVWHMPGRKRRAMLAQVAQGVTRPAGSTPAVVPAAAARGAARSAARGAACGAQTPTWHAGASRSAVTAFMGVACSQKCQT